MGSTSTSWRIRTSGLRGRTTPWACSASRSASRTSLDRLGKSWRRTAASIPGRTAGKPSESCPRRWGNDGGEGATPRGPNSERHSPAVRSIPRSLQRLRGRTGRPSDLRLEDEDGAPEPAGRVLLLQVGVHGRERRGRPSGRLDALPPDGQTAGHLPRRDPRARPRPTVPGGQGAVPGGLRVPQCAHRDRSLPYVRGRRPTARHGRCRAVRVPEGRMDGREGRTKARTQRWRPAASTQAQRDPKTGFGLTHPTAASLERREPRLFRLRTLELRHPNAEEPDPMRVPGEFGEEFPAYPRQHVLVEDVRRQGPFPEMGLEAFEPDLDPDRPEGRALSTCPQEDVVRHVAQRLFDPAPVRDVPLERPLDADRLRVRPLFDGELFEAARDAPQPNGVLPQNLLELRPFGSSQLADRPDSDAFEQLGGLRADPADLRDRKRIEEGGHLLGTHDLQTVGLRQIRRNLGDGLVRRGADRAGQTLPFAYGRLDAECIRRRVVEAAYLRADVKKRFVDAHMLEDIREGPQDVDDALRDGPVEIVVRSEVDRVRRLAPRQADGHAAPDPDLAGLVAASHHDAAALAAFRIGTDDNRLPDELRMIPPFHADVEGIHVYMEDNPRRLEHLNYDMHIGLTRLRRGGVLGRLLQGNEPPEARLELGLIPYPVCREAHDFLASPRPAQLELDNPPTPDHLQAHPGDVLE